MGREAVTIPSILHKGQILTHLHTASQNLTPTSCGVSVIQRENKQIKKCPQTNKYPETNNYL